MSETTTNNTTETAQPTHSEMTDWYKKQIEIAELRTRLAQLHSEAMKYEWEKMEAIVKLGHLRTVNPNDPEDEEDQEEPQPEAKPTDRKLKK